MHVLRSTAGGCCRRRRRPCFQTGTDDRRTLLLPVLFSRGNATEMESAERGDEHRLAVKKRSLSAQSRGL